MDNPLRKSHQNEIEQGLKFPLTQLATELTCSEAWRRVWMAAHAEGRSVEALVADGIMAAVEAVESALVAAGSTRDGASLLD